MYLVSIETQVFFAKLRKWIETSPEYYCGQKSVQERIHDFTSILSDDMLKDNVDQLLRKATVSIKFGRSYINGVQTCIFCLTGLDLILTTYYRNKTGFANPRLRARNFEIYSCNF